MSGGRSGLALLLAMTAACASAGTPGGSSGPRQESVEPAGLLLVNGRIWTNDSRQAEATALLVRNGRIAWVGETADAPASPQIRRLDLAGRRVVPGFNDAHTHLFDGGWRQLAPELLETATPEAFAARLGAHVATLPPGRWVYLTYTWDHERWPGHPLPSRALIDPVTGDHPVFLTRTDGHIGVANTVALARAGITRDTPDPPGGQIDRDPATGEPTGILRDAEALINAVRTPPTDPEVREALDAALAHAARVGVTSLQDMCYGATPMNPEPARIRLLQEYARDGRLTARVYCRTPLLSAAVPITMGITAGFGDEWVRLGSLKAFADGALGSSTAFFFEPYLDTPETRGLLDATLTPPDSFYGLAVAADAARLQLSIHAIGDAAISLVLDQFTKIRAANPAWDRRWRIEHAQHLAPKDFARFADLDVIASVQPFHAIDDGRWAERKIGPARARMTYPFRAFLDAGVRLAFGTDWPVAPLNPLVGIYAAVTRRTLDDAHPGGWVPEEKITVAEALAAYTSGSAYAEFAEREKGRLAPGYLADLVVLSDDPFTVAPESLRDITVELTMVGGRIVYEAAGAADSLRD